MDLVAVYLAVKPLSSPSCLHLPLFPPSFSPKQSQFSPLDPQLAMSAGPSPPNPGQPRNNPNIPKPSALRRLGPALAAGALAAGLAYTFFSTRAPAPPGTPPPNPLRTPGVKNVEQAYQNAGATATHTKAYGGSVQGQKDSPVLREGGGTGKEKGFDSHEGIGDSQRPWPKTKAGEAFDTMNYGQEKGK